METSKRSWWAQVMHNRLVALVLAMTVIVPLVATPADSSMHGLAALAFEGFALVLLTTLLLRLRWNPKSEQVRSFFQTGANAPVLALLGLATVSYALSSYKAYSGQEFLRLGAGVLLYFVVGYQFRRSEHLSKLVDALLFVAIGTALIGFTQFGAGSKEFAIGLFGDHQLFGSFLMLLLPIVAVVAITEKAPNRQLAAQIATVLTATCLLLAHSRSAWIGGLAGMLTLGALALFASIRNNNTNTKVATVGLRAKKHELVLPLMLLVVSTGFFLLVAPQSSGILKRVGTLGDFAQDSTWTTRQATWNGALKMVMAHPLTGVGLGNYAVYQKAYTHNGMNIAFLHTNPSLAEQAHNLYLQTAAELGIPGLLLLVGALAAFWVGGLRRIGKMEAGLRRSLLMGSMAASVAFAVDGLSSPSWQLPQVSMFFWLVLGLGLSCMRPHSKRTEEEAQAPALATRVGRPVSVFASLALAALLPTAVLAVGPGYTNATPQSATLTPKGASIRGGQAQIYTLTVHFSDGSDVDVSTLPNTTFSQTGGIGAMVGSNNRSYQSRFRERDTPTIKGSYIQNGVTVMDTAPLTVHFP